MVDAQARTFLFLQGPHGPFFAMLAEALRARGHRALRININGGDKVDWPGEGATDYRGTFRNWPIFFDDHIVHQCEIGRASCREGCGRTRSYRWWPYNYK